jgi:hypothetical protein
MLRGCEANKKGLISRLSELTRPQDIPMKSGCQIFQGTGSFEIRRRRSLISAQRLERSENPGIGKSNLHLNPERVRLDPFRVQVFFMRGPKVVATLQPLGWN